MTRQDMEAEVSQLLLEQRRLARLGLKLGPEARLRLERLLYRLGWTRSVPMSRRDTPRRYTLDINETIRQGIENSRGRRQKNGTTTQDTTTGKVLGDALDEAGEPHAPFFRSLVHEEQSGGGLLTDKGLVLRSAGHGHPLYINETGDGDTRWFFRPTTRPGTVLVMRQHVSDQMKGHSHAAVMDAPALREWANHPKVGESLRGTLLAAAEHLSPSGGPQQMTRRDAVTRYANGDLTATKVTSITPVTPATARPRPKRPPLFAPAPMTSTSDRVNQDLRLFRQHVRSKHTGVGGVTPNSPEDRVLLHDFAVQRGLIVKLGDNRYDAATHTLYHSTPNDKRAVAEAYIGHGQGRVRLTRRREALVRYTEGVPGNPADPPVPAEGEQQQQPAPEWDGSIDDGDVTEHDELHRENVAEFDNWTSDGEHLVQHVHVASGEFTPPGHTEPRTVYRWVHHDHEGDQVGEGDWTEDADEAHRQGEEHAASSNEDPPEPDDEHINNPSEQSWRNRNHIQSYWRDGNERLVRLEEGEFEFAGQTHSCYRWTTQHDRDGDWTLDRRQAISDGEEYASDRDEGEPQEGEESEGIHPYSYKPTYEPLGDKPPYYGAELETQLKDSSRLSLDEAVQHTLSTLNRGLEYEQFAYLKEDSSIESGSPHTGKGTFEIVTQPATLAVHRQQWTPFFASPPAGLISHDANAGLHVHVGREHLSKLGIGKMFYFINNPANKNFLTKLARRESPRWAAMDPTKKVTDVSRPPGSRYTAMNLSPTHTVEFRLFRGTLKPDSFFTAMEFVDALVNLTQPGMSSVADMDSPDTLIRYVTTFHKDYPNLLTFIEGYLGRRLVNRGPRKKLARPVPATPRWTRRDVPLSARVLLSGGRPPSSSRPLPPRQLTRRTVAVRYAKADTRHEAHPLVAGFPIEHALRHMANDASRSDTVRNLSKRALTTGDTSALWGLHDATQEDGKGVPGGYNLMSAADKIHLDAKTRLALEAEANDTKTGVPPEHHGSFTYSPEHHAERAERALAKHRGYRNDHFLRADRDLLDRIRQRVKAAEPTIDHKLIDESIRRHAHRAWRVGNETNYGPNNPVFASHDREQALKPLVDMSADDASHSKTLQATRYRRRHVFRYSLESSIRTGKVPHTLCPVCGTANRAPSTETHMVGCRGCGIEYTGRGKGGLWDQVTESWAKPKTTINEETGFPERQARRYAKSNRSDFLDALRRLKSSNHTALTDAATNVAARMGMGDTHVFSALHDTPQGSVPGVAQAIYSATRPETVHALAAWVNGLLPNGPGYAVFHARDNGPDTLYRIRHDGSGMDVRVRLDRAGIKSRIMVPHRRGFDVLVPDKGNKLAKNVAEYAQTHGLTVEASPGHFQTVGSSDQAQARDTFRSKVVAGERAQLSRKRVIRYAQPFENVKPAPLNEEWLHDFSVPVLHHDGPHVSVVHYAPRRRVTEAGNSPWAWEQSRYDPALPETRKHLPRKFDSEDSARAAFPHAMTYGEFLGNDHPVRGRGSERPEHGTFLLTPEEVHLATDGREGTPPVQSPDPHHDVGGEHTPPHPEDYYAMRRRDVATKYAKVPQSEEGVLTPEQLAIAERAYATGNRTAWGALGDHLQENGYPNAGAMLSRHGAGDESVTYGSGGYGRGTERPQPQPGMFMYRVLRDGSDLIHQAEVYLPNGLRHSFVSRERPNRSQSADKLSRRRRSLCRS